MQNKNKDMCIITGKSLKLHKKIVFEKKIDIFDEHQSYTEQEKYLH